MLKPTVRFARWREYVHFHHIIRFSRFVRFVYRALCVPASVRLVPVNSFITRNTLVAFVSFVLFVSQRLPPRACPDLSQGGWIGENRDL